MKSALLPTLADVDAPSAYHGLDLLATAVLLLDRDLSISYVNPAAENLFELSKRQFLGRKPKEVFADAGELLGAIDKAVRAGAAYAEQELELGVLGKGKLHLACTVSPVEIGAVTLLLELRHIDQQLKIAREERLQEQQQANRDLIRNLAHEIKNPLGGIRGAAQLLERELEQPPLIEYTQVIIGEADRLRSLVNRLLTPNRLPSCRRVNIHQILVRVKGVVQAEFPHVTFVSDFDTSLPDIDADPEQLTQAVLNIVRNAAQAVSGTTAGPRICLKTRVARSVTLARKHHRLALAVCIADNGPGVPAALRDRHLLPAGVRPRGRQWTGPHDRADLRLAAQRDHRVRERAGGHRIHHPAPAGSRPGRYLIGTDDAWLLSTMNPGRAPR